MSELLLELFSEEIPAMMQEKASSSYLEIVKNFFTERNVKFSSASNFYGPRRITLHFTGLADFTEILSEELKGPKCDAPQKAIEGFCQGNGINFDQLVIKEVKGVNYYFFIQQKEAEKVSDLIAKHMPELIGSYVWPKSMYWGDHKIKWVRPLHNILCIFNQEIVRFNYGHLTSNNKTYGHRFMADNIGLEISNFADYQQKLRNNFIILDAKEREEIIVSSIEKISKNNNLQIEVNSKLLQEVVGLVEYPVAMMGEINQKFLKLPKEVLISSMEQHQKYFSANDQDGNFAANFIFVANNNTSDHDIIIDGNQRVLSARLEDALYFYQQDIQKTDEHNKQSLAAVIFHAKLGNLYDKSLRMQKIVEYLAPGNEELSKAALLCKTDIVSEMVDEFPNLQGLIGYYYAKAKGQSDVIASAIKNHYKPQGTSDSCPSGSDALLALADKIDNLVGLMLVGERATGSKDPYALRRQALAIIRILLENKLDINLSKLIEFALDLHDLKVNQIDQEILSFIEDRLKYYLKDNYSLGIINAALDLTKESNLNKIQVKINALSEFVNRSEGEDLIAVYRRSCNILAGQKIDLAVNDELFNNQFERELYQFIKVNSEVIRSYLKNQQYEQLFVLLISIKDLLFKFFDNVMVKDNDVKIANNRLAILANVQAVFNEIADFSKL